MAFPLVGNPLSSGVRIIDPSVTRVEMSITRVWSPILPFSPQRSSPGIRVIIPPNPVRIAAIRIWSGNASATGVWPEHGQGWPRISQR